MDSFLDFSQMEISTEDFQDRVDCDICNKKYILKKDYEKHLKSKRHLHKTTSLTTHVSENFQCKICAKNFTEKKIFLEHLDSLEHKNNASTFRRKGRKKKSSRLDVTESTESQSIGTTFHLRSLYKRNILEKVSLQLPAPAEQDEDFVREKFRTRTDSQAFTLIAQYVYSIVSYLAIKLSLDATIEDIGISVNDRRYQSYGDIVVHITYNEQIKRKEGTIFAVRCKHVSSMHKEIDDLNDIKITDVKKEYDSINSLKNVKDFKITKFVIFTTCHAGHNFQKSVDYVPSKEGSPVRKLNIIPGKKIQPVDVSRDSDNTFFLSPEDSDFELPPLFIYTNQKVFLSNIDELVKKHFQSYPNSIFREYQRFTEMWANGLLGGNYLLTKKDVILKLGELLLEPYIMVPKIVNFKNADFEVWNHIVEKVDVIIVKTEPFILSKLCEPFNKTIETVLAVKFDPVTKTINITKETLDQLKYPKVRAYLFEENAVDSEVHLFKIYMVFWKAGKIPLLLSLENNEDSKGFVLDVISFMKTYDVHKKFLIKSEKIFQFSKKPPKNLKIFSRLEDVKEFVDLSKLKIKVKDNANEMSLTLEDINKSDSFFLKWITPSIFFDIVLDTYSLRKNNSSEFDVQGELKIILDDETRCRVHKLFYKSDCQEENLGRLKGISPNLF